MKSPPLSAPAWLYRKPSWLQRLALGLVSILALVATFAVASVVFAALLVIGLAVERHMTAVLEGEYEIEPGPPALEDRTVSSRPTVDSAPPHPRVP